MAFTLGIAQTGYPTQGDVLVQARHIAQQAAEQGVDLLVFPENFMCPHELTATELRQIAEPTDGHFANGICELAQQHNLWIVSTMSEINPTGGPPFNTAVVTAPDGTRRGTYRKCHLYDAHGTRESDRMTAGGEPSQPVDTPFCTLGLGICYDLRFPEFARCLALAGCDLIVFPAAWHDGPNKALHWQTLLRARAIENECYVAGACHGANHCVGKGHVFDPLGNVLASGSDVLLVCQIDPAMVRTARDAMPIFRHRKPELYGQLIR